MTSLERLQEYFCCNLCKYMSYILKYAHRRSQEAHEASKAQIYSNIREEMITNEKL